MWDSDSPEEILGNQEVKPWISAKLKCSKTEIDLSARQLLDMDVSLTLHADAPIIFLHNDRPRTLHRKWNIQFYRQGVEGARRERFIRIHARRIPHDYAYARSCSILEPGKTVTFQARFHEKHRNDGDVPSFDRVLSDDFSTFVPGETYDVVLKPWKISRWRWATAEDGRCIESLGPELTGSRFVAEQEPRLSMPWYGDQPLGSLTVRPEEHNISLRCVGELVSQTSAPEESSSRAGDSEEV